MNAIFLRDDQDDWNNVDAIELSGIPVARVGIQIDVPNNAGQSAFQEWR